MANTLFSLVNGQTGQAFVGELKPALRTTFSDNEIMVFKDKETFALSLAENDLVSCKTVSGKLTIQKISAGNVGDVLSVLSNGGNVTLAWAPPGGAGSAANWANYVAVANINADGKKIINLLAPTENTDGANKAYVDTSLESIITQLESYADSAASSAQSAAITSSNNYTDTEVEAAKTEAIADSATYTDTKAAEERTYVNSLPALLKTAPAETMANSQNIGALNSGFLKTTNSAGTATLSSQASIGVSDGGTGISSLTGEGSKVLAVNSGATAYEFVTKASISSRWSDSNATQDVNLNSNKIINLAEPTNNTDASTKLYVDSEISTVETQIGVVQSSIDALETAIDAFPVITTTNSDSLGGATNLGAGTSGFVKSTVSGSVSTISTVSNISSDEGGTGLTNASLTAGNLLTVNGTANGYEMSTKASVAALWSGQAATGDINANGNKITNLGTPSTGTDATPKDYVDTLVGATVPINRGGTGQTTKAAAFDALAPAAGTPAQADIMYWNGTTWAVLESPSSNGTHTLQCAVAGAARVLSWVI